LLAFSRSGRDKRGLSLIIGFEKHGESMSKYKIWFQGATDKVHMAPYIAKVEAHLKSILEPEFEATFHSTTPPATTTHAITEFRIARNLIRNAVEAEKQGYAAMAITHFQDAGLAEVKSVVDIPVLGLGETTLFHACTLGRKLGLITINPVFVPWHEDQVIRYGLQSRVVGVRAVEATVKDFIDAFADKRAYDSLYPRWERECRILLDAGADVIVPAGGLPMMLFGGSEMEGAPVVNGITLIAKSAEMAVKLRPLGMAKVSRRSSYAKPPEKALREFLEQG
jgi:Asp/Glu/hydantoin racemase